MYRIIYCKSAIFSNHLPTTIFGKGEKTVPVFYAVTRWMPDGNCTALERLENITATICVTLSSGFFNFCLSSPIWLQRKVRFIDLIIFRERGKLS